jgi:hypothetical protein
VGLLSRALIPRSQNFSLTRSIEPIYCTGKFTWLLANPCEVPFRLWHQCPPHVFMSHVANSPYFTDMAVAANSVAGDLRALIMNRHWIQILAAIASG